MGHQRCHDHGTHTYHRTDGQVNVPCNQYVTLCNSDQKIFGHGTQEIQYILPGKYSRIDNTKRRIDQYQSYESRQSGSHTSHAQKSF